MSGGGENLSWVQAELRKFHWPFLNKDFQFILRNLYLGYVHREVKFY